MGRELQERQPSPGSPPFSPLFSPYFYTLFNPGFRPISDRILANCLRGVFVSDERRRTPRFPFIATTEIIEKPGQPGINARVTELSLYGCYVEMPHPLEKGAPLMLKIYSEGRYFESNGIVLYSQPNSGIGVGFQNVNPHYLTTLKRWLLEAAHAKFGQKE